MGKQRRGITLIALVITIIILLILAGITINLTIGQRGILTRAEEAGRNYREAAKYEDGVLGELAKFDINRVEPTEVWWKIEGTTLYFNNSQKDENYKKADDDYIVDWETETYKSPEWAGYYDEENDKEVFSPVTTVVFENLIAPVNTVDWFYYLGNLTEIKNIQNLNTSNVTDMSGMFFGCKKLVNLDLTNFDTHNVKDMKQMFGFCSSLVELDLKGFDTSNVENMALMFHWMNNIKELKVSNFITNKVKNMQNMFSGCYKLQTLDISNFDTKNVSNMFGMFRQCFELKTIKFGELFNTSNVTDLAYMFWDCQNLEELDLTSFDTNSATNMDGMFYDCTNLKSILIGDRWKIVENAKDVFYNCGVSDVTKKSK